MENDLDNVHKDADEAEIFSSSVHRFTTFKTLYIVLQPLKRLYIVLRPLTRVSGGRQAEDDLEDAHKTADDNIDEADTFRTFYDRLSNVSHPLKIFNDRRGRL